MANHKAPEPTPEIAEAVTRLRAYLDRERQLVELFDCRPGQDVTALLRTAAVVDPNAISDYLKKVMSPTSDEAFRSPALAERAIVAAEVAGTLGLNACKRTIQTVLAEVFERQGPKRLNQPLRLSKALKQLRAASTPEVLRPGNGDRAPVVAEALALLREGLGGSTVSSGSTLGNLRVDGDTIIAEGLDSERSFPAFPRPELERALSWMVRNDDRYAVEAAELAARKRLRNLEGPVRDLALSLATRFGEKSELHRERVEGAWDALASVNGHHHTIYALCLFGTPLYIGQTGQPPLSRLTCHRAEVNRNQGNQPVYTGLATAMGLCDWTRPEDFTIRVVDRCKPADALRAESYYMELFYRVLFDEYPGTSQTLLLNAEVVNKPKAPEFLARGTYRPEAGVALAEDMLRQFLDNPNNCVAQILAAAQGMHAKDRSHGGKGGRPRITVVAPEDSYAGLG